MKRSTVLRLAAFLAGLSGPAAMAASPAEWLGYLQDQHQALLAVAQRCQAEAEMVNRQNAINAANGIMPQQAPCMQYMPEVVGQMAFVEAQIYRVQTGDTRTPLSCITGIKVGSQGCPAGR